MRLPLHRWFVCTWASPALRICFVQNELRVYYEKKKYVPLDLRAKKTRALRRQLPPEHAAIKTAKQLNKEKHFPKRRYAVEAYMTAGRR